MARGFFGRLVDGITNFAERIFKQPEEREPPPRKPDIQEYEPPVRPTQTQQQQEFSGVQDSGYTIDDFYADVYDRVEDFLPEDLSEDQLAAVIDLIEEQIEEGWDWIDIYDAMYEDFWEWFREGYEGD